MLAYFWQHVFDVAFPPPIYCRVLLLYRVIPTIIIEFLISFSLTEVKKFLSFSFISFGVKL